MVTLVKAKVNMLLTLTFVFFRAPPQDFMMILVDLFNIKQLLTPKTGTHHIMYWDCGTYKMVGDKWQSVAFLDHEQHIVLPVVRVV